MTINNNRIHTFFSFAVIALLAVGCSAPGTADPGLVWRNNGSGQTFDETGFLGAYGMNLPAYHGNRLLEGDFRDGGPPQMPNAFGGDVPYHLSRLVAFGGFSNDVLLTMLEVQDETPVPIGEDGGINELGLGADNRRARMSDLAAWALRVIYGTEFGFRGDASDEERREAIRQWRDHIEKTPLEERRLGNGSVLWPAE